MKFSELVKLLEKKGFRLLKEKGRGNTRMVDVSYDLVIEATKEPDFFSFFSPELEGFSGVGHSVEDCIYNAKWGMKEHVELLREQNMPVPPQNKDPKIIIQNAKELVA